MAQFSTGFRRFNAQIIPEKDTRLQNNQASAFTVVYGPPSILIVEGSPGEGQNMQTALEAAEMQVQRLAPGQMPTTLPELAAYDAVFLMNVNAAALPDESMQALPLFVKDLGKGLLMTGGADSFGAGGYLRSALEAALPVDMDVRNRDLQANLALVLAVDKSGSMGRCHCDNPDLNQTYSAPRSASPRWISPRKPSCAPPAPWATRISWVWWLLTAPPVGCWTWPSWSTRLPWNRLSGASGRWQHQPALWRGGCLQIPAGGGRQAQAYHPDDRRLGARRRPLFLAQQIQSEGITLSVIAAGEGSAEYLKGLATMGGGRFYPATDILNVPEIFLKETVQSVGEYIIEEPFYPLPAVPLRFSAASTRPPYPLFSVITALPPRTPPAWICLPLAAIPSWLPGNMVWVARPPGPPT